MVSNEHSELWKKLPWKKFQKNLFRLQCRIYKAARTGNRKLVLRLQKLILRSQSARMLAIRQVTQLNKGKKTAVQNLKHWKSNRKFPRFYVMN
ncbi:MAG: hypothetical protein HC908_00375 [Calothrix sp. SM1_7_51]|nr:hypothetical protein [Calothrix sp. SM1_7_51]